MASEGGAKGLSPRRLIIEHAHLISYHTAWFLDNGPELASNTNLHQNGPAFSSEARGRKDM